MRLIDKFLLPSKNWKEQIFEILNVAIDFVHLKITPMREGSIQQQINIINNKQNSESMTENTTATVSSLQTYLETVVRALEGFVHLIDTSGCMFSSESSPEILTKIIEVFSSYESITTQKIQNKLYEIFFMRFFSNFDCNFKHHFYPSIKLSEKLIISGSEDYNKMVIRLQGLKVIFDIYIFEILSFFYIN